MTLAKIQIVALSNRTVAALATPFHGGGGLTHSAIELIWTSADAYDYLGEGNKLDRVLGGLRALRDGRLATAGRPGIPADHDKLQVVASDLATHLVAAGFLDADAADEALQESPSGPYEKASPSTRPRDTAVSHNPAPSPPSHEHGLADDPRAVMVIHGQDVTAARAMFDWLRAVGLRPREWSQLINASGTASPFIGEVLEVAFRQAQAVVVLFTPDEHVQLRSELDGAAPSWRLQARPNVLFEAGMAFAMHPKRSVLVVLGDQQIPSDLAGRHYVLLGSVRTLRDLAQRLEEAGCPVDLTGDDWLDLGRFPDRSGITTRPTM